MTNVLSTCMVPLLACCIRCVFSTDGKLGNSRGWRSRQCIKDPAKQTASVYDRQYLKLPIKELLIKLNTTNYLLHSNHTVTIVNRQYAVQFIIFVAFSHGYCGGRCALLRIDMVPRIYHWELLYLWPNRAEGTFPSCNWCPRRWYSLCRCLYRRGAEHQAARRLY